ncbi:MAG: TRAP transporter small permease [Neomegalonema sp.]|nr:TRAP transporter small permease [Neomegalonema sp.]
MAIVGGLALSALILLTCVSIIGVGLNTIGHSGWLTSIAPGIAKALLSTGVGPINGDFELVEAGMAFAIFSFLPICQLYRGHAKVDLIDWITPKNASKWLETFWEFVLTASILLITWRLYAGLLNQIKSGETTFLLEFPVWWSYVASFAAAIVASIVAVCCAGARLLETITGASYLPTSEGAS